eukprot:g7987.t1
MEGKHIPSDPSMDWAGNYAQMLGVSDDALFKDVTRMYLMLHADHEAGNVSAHTTHLVGSALSDPYYSYAAGECLRWLKNTRQELGGKEPTVEVLTQFAKDTLASGKVIPGFGHGVLRNTDPRYVIQRQFAQDNFPNDPLVKLAEVCFQAIPPVLEATGKVKKLGCNAGNPWPNVDALSGTCMQYFGLDQEDYYTVIFAVSRALGCTSNLVWSRMMGLPIERASGLPWHKRKELCRECLQGQGPLLDGQRCGRRHMMCHRTQSAQRSTSSSRARPEADVPVQLHPVAWVRALRAQASQSAIQSQEVTEANSAKAQAVAALQRLFFEALRSGQDANGAAAQALRRLLAWNQLKQQRGRRPAMTKSMPSKDQELEEGERVLVL